MVRRFMRSLAVLLAFAACTPLPTIATGECGNAVLDDDEDCDSFVDEALGGPLECRACRYVCSGDAVCPGGWACGVDEVYRPPAGKFLARAPLRLPVGRVETADLDGDGRLDLFGSDRLGFGVAYGNGE